MTVQTNTNVASFNGDGANKAFPIGYKFNSAADLVVTLIDDEAKTTQILTLNSDFTVTGAGDEEGGGVTLAVAPTAVQRLKVTRVVDILQLTDLRNQGKFYAEIHEDVFDLLIMIDQQQQTEIDDANAKSDEAVATADEANEKSDQAVAKAGQNLVDMQAQYDALEQGAALYVIGDYTSGLVVSAYNQTFRRDGEFYRAAASLDLPYTLTGNWANESVNFVSVGDAVLRQDLASATDPAKGAGMVAFGVAEIGLIGNVRGRLAREIYTSDFAPDSEKTSLVLDYVFANNLKLIVDSDVVLDAPIEIASGRGVIECTSGRFIAAPTIAASEDYGYALLMFSSEVTNSELNLKFDLGNVSIGGALLGGHSNKISVSSVGGKLADGISQAISLLEVSGHDNEVTVKAINLQVSATSNRTRALTVSALAKRTKVNTIYVSGGASAIVDNGSGTHVSLIIADSVSGNAVYGIEGQEDFYLDRLFANNCLDEVAAFSGAKRPSIGSVYAVNCARGVGFFNVDHLSIAELNWTVDNETTHDTGAPLYVRPGGQASGGVSIGVMQVRGRWGSGYPLVGIGSPVGYIKINTLNAELSVVGAGQNTTLGTLEGVDRLQVGEMSIRISDDGYGLTSSDVYRLPVPSTLSIASRIDSLSLSNDGGLHDVRVTNVAHPRLRITSMNKLNSTAGTPFVQQDDAEVVLNRTFYSGAIPTTGTWLRGDRVLNQTPNGSGTEGWVCVVAGTPGTWKTLGVIGA